MNRSVSIFLKVTLSTVLGLLSVPTLCFGSYFLWCWVRVHTSNVYYVRAAYGTVGIVFLAFGLLSIWATLYAIWKRKLLLIVVPVLVCWTTARIISEGTPQGFSGLNDGMCMAAVDSSLRAWYENHQRFPTDEGEFREAVDKGLVSLYGAGWPESRYAQSGNLLPYKIIVNASAAGPHLDASGRPGVIYYCISGDLQEYWVTMTTLQREVSTSASLKQTVGPPQVAWIVHARGRDYPIENKGTRKD
jgi:hypothetical protein